MFYQVKYWVCLLAFGIAGSLVIKASEPDTARAASLIQQGRDYNDQALFDSSIYVYEEALAIYEQTELWDRILEAETGIAKGWRQKGAYDKADHMVTDALKEGLRHLPENHIQIARSNYQAAITAYYMRNYEDARQHCQKNIDILMEHEGPYSVDIANAYATLGLSYGFDGYVNKGISYYHKSIDTYGYAGEDSHPWIATPYNGLGVAYEHKTDYAQAMKYYQKALKLALQAPDESFASVAAAYSNLGVVHQRMEDFEQAIAYF